MTDAYGVGVEIISSQAFRLCARDSLSSFALSQIRTHGWMREWDVKHLEVRDTKLRILDVSLAERLSWKARCRVPKSRFLALPVAVFCLSKKSEARLVGAGLLKVRDVHRLGRSAVYDILKTDKRSGGAACSAADQILDVMMMYGVEEWGHSLARSRNL